MHSIFFSNIAKTIFVTTIFEDLNVLLPCKEGMFVLQGETNTKIKNMGQHKKDPSHGFIAKAWSHNNYIRIVVHKLQLYVSIHMS
jgi:hypothetical protein